jgi:hypothetical protein
VLLFTYEKKISPALRIPNKIDEGLPDTHEEKITRSYEDTYLLEAVIEFFWSILKK